MSLRRKFIGLPINERKAYARLVACFDPYIDSPSADANLLNQVVRENNIGWTIKHINFNSKGELHSLYDSNLGYLPAITFMQEEGEISFYLFNGMIYPDYPCLIYSFEQRIREIHYSNIKLQHTKQIDRITSLYSFRNGKIQDYIQLPHSAEYHHQDLKKKMPEMPELELDNGTNFIMPYDLFA